MSVTIQCDVPETSGKKQHRAPQLLDFSKKGPLFFPVEMSPPWAPGKAGTGPHGKDLENR